MRYTCHVWFGWSRMTNLNTNRRTTHSTPHSDRGISFLSPPLFTAKQYDGLEDKGGICKIGWMKRSTRRDLKSTGDWLILLSKCQTWHVRLQIQSKWQTVRNAATDSSLWYYFRQSEVEIYYALNPKLQKRLQLSSLHIRSINHSGGGYFLKLHFD